MTAPDPDPQKGIKEFYAISTAAWLDSRETVEQVERTRPSFHVTDEPFKLPPDLREEDNLIADLVAFVLAAAGLALFAVLAVLYL